MITYNKNNLANMFRFSRDVFNHMMEFVTSNEPYHTFNLDSWVDSSIGYDFLTNREYLDGSNDAIKYDLKNYNNGVWVAEDVTVNVTGDDTSYNILSAKITYNESNICYKISLSLKTSKSFTKGLIYHDTTNGIYIRCVDANAYDGYIFEVIGADDLEIMAGIVNGNKILGGNVQFETPDTIYNNINFLKVEAEKSLSPKVNDYIRFWKSTDVIFEAKILNVYNNGEYIYIRLNKYMENINDVNNIKVIYYKNITMSAPKLVQRNYLTLPTMNYFNRYMNDHKIIDKLGDSLYVTPGAIKILNSDIGSPEILIRNDNYINVYTEGASMTDGFYIVNFKYEKISLNHDIRYNTVAKLSGNIINGYQSIGGVIIKDNKIQSFFNNDENESSKVDLYKKYSQNSANIYNNMLISNIQCKLDDSMLNIKNRIDMLNYDNFNITREDIESVLDALDLNNVIYRVNKFNGEILFDIITTNFNNEDRFEMVRIDKYSLYTFNSFTLIHKLH